MKCNAILKVGVLQDMMPRLTNSCTRDLTPVSLLQRGKKRLYNRSYSSMRSNQASRSVLEYSVRSNATMQSRSRKWRRSGSIRSYVHIKIWDYTLNARMYNWQYDTNLFGALSLRIYPPTRFVINSEHFLCPYLSSSGTVTIGMVFFISVVLWDEKADLDGTEVYIVIEKVIWNAPG